MKTANNIGKCANCNSANIEYGSSNLHDDMHAYDYFCEDCKESGKEWFNLTYIETIKY